MSDEIAVVRAWHEAVNAADVERLTALSSDDIVVGGPRGTGQGAQLLRDWFGRAGIRLEPRQVFQRQEVVVVEQDAAWPAPGADTASGPQVVASAFVVRAGRVASVMRHPDLTTALRASGLTESDRV